jgi:hypothetical protein
MRSKTYEYSPRRPCCSRKPPLRCFDNRGPKNVVYALLLLRSRVILWIRILPAARGVLQATPVGLPPGVQDGRGKPSSPLWGAYLALAPPSTAKAIPVTHSASRETRNSTHWATSWGVPKRGQGVSCKASLCHCSISGLVGRVSAVGIRPGQLDVAGLRSLFANNIDGVDLQVFFVPFLTSFLL